MPRRACESCHTPVVALRRRERRVQMYTPPSDRSLVGRYEPAPGTGFEVSSDRANGNHVGEAGSQVSASLAQNYWRAMADRRSRPASTWRRRRASRFLKVPRVSQLPRVRFGTDGKRAADAATHRTKPRSRRHLVWHKSAKDDENTKRAFDRVALKAAFGHSATPLPRITIARLCDSADRPT